MRKAVLAAIMLGILAPTAGALARSGCASQPLPPLPSVNCKTLRPVCRCDSKGQNCHWKFICKR